MLARKITPPLAVVIAFLAGCSDGTDPSNNAGSVTLRIVAGAAPSSSAAAPDTVRVANHLLVLERVEIVLREIELERVNGSGACEDADDDDHEDDEKGHADHEEDECEEFVTGPVLVDVPLGGGLEKLITVDVDPGRYDRVEFKLHKPTEHGGDNAFLAAHPEFKDVSVRVEGTFDGKPFTFESDVTAKQKSDLVPPLEVTERASRSLTLVVEAASWFLRGGVGLIDPVSAADGQPNENIVRDNIRRSFRLFEDGNGDGHEDHEHDDDD